MEASVSQRLLQGVAQTARLTLLTAVGELLRTVKTELQMQLETYHDDQRARVDAARELVLVERRWQQALQLAVERMFSTRDRVVLAEPEVMTLVDESQVEAQLAVARIAHTISHALDWQVADLNARMSFLHGHQGVNPELNMVRPEKLAQMAFDSIEQSGLSKEARVVLLPMFCNELGALTVQLYHDLNAWLIKAGVLPKIDLRPLMVRSRSANRWQEISKQSLEDIKGSTESNAEMFKTGVFRAMRPDQAAAAMAGGAAAGPSSGGQGHEQRGHEQRGHDTQPGRSRMPQFQDSSPFDGPDLSELRGEVENNPLIRTVPPPLDDSGGNAHGHGHGGDSRARPDKAGLWNRVQVSFKNKFSQTIRRGGMTSRNVERFDDSGFAEEAGLGGRIEVMNRRVAQPYAEADMSEYSPRVQLDAAPRIIDFKEELQQAASSANERAVIEIVALMFDHILQDESVPPIARVLFARLQIPVLRVAVRESELFLEENHPARDFIDRLGSSIAGYAGDAAVDETLLGEMRRLVQLSEKTQSGSGGFFVQLLQEFDTFLTAYGRDLREISTLGVPLLEQTEDFKVFTVLYTIELRRLMDDVPCDKRLRDFLLHNWVGVLSSAGIRYGGKSTEVSDFRRVAVDLLWCGLPKANARERAQLVSTMPDLMNRVAKGLSIATMDQATQERIVSRIRSLLLQIMRAPVSQAPDLVFDALVAKLAEMESSFELAGEKSKQYRIPLATLRAQIAEKAIPLEVLEPSDFGLPDDLSASHSARDWVGKLAVGSWFHLKIGQTRRSVLQLSWVSPLRNYLLFTDPMGTAGIITEPNTLAILSQRADFTPVEYESLTDRATRTALQKVGEAAIS